MQSRTHAELRSALDTLSSTQRSEHSQNTVSCTRVHIPFIELAQQLGGALTAALGGTEDEAGELGDDLGDECRQHVGVAGALLPLVLLNTQQTPRSKPDCQPSQRA